MKVRFWKNEEKGLEWCKRCAFRYVKIWNLRLWNKKIWCKHGQNNIVNVFWCFKLNWLKENDIVFGIAKSGKWVGKWNWTGCGSMPGLFKNKIGAASAFILTHKILRRLLSAKKYGTVNEELRCYKLVREAGRLHYPQDRHNIKRCTKYKAFTERLPHWEKMDCPSFKKSDPLPFVSIAI